MLKRIICTVTNDLNYDQRMKRICTSLQKAGYEVTLVGRERPFSQPLSEQPFRQVRLKGRFEKGFLFYAEYNLRLFFFLLSNKFDLVNAIDLDSILPCYLVSKWRKKPIIYDAHEYFTELEEVVSRPRVKRVWEWIERETVPKIPHGYTVSKGYAELFKDKYGVDYEQVRNVTRLQKLPANLPDEEPYILYQGSVNVGRGLDVLIKAMHSVENYKLYICGLGNLYDEMRILVRTEGLEHKVKFKGYVEPELLRNYTARATLGFTLFSDDGLSNRHSLANRFFDYLHHGVPQIAMNYPEYRRFNEKFEVAVLIDHLTVEEVSGAINRMLNNPRLISEMKENCLAARAEHHWEKDEQRMLKVFENAFNEHAGQAVV